MEQHTSTTKPAMTFKRNRWRANFSQDVSYTSKLVSHLAWEGLTRQSKYCTIKVSLAQCRC
jgi:hypothetical protein